MQSKAGHRSAVQLLDPLARYVTVIANSAIRPLHLRDQNICCVAGSLVGNEIADVRKIAVTPSAMPFAEKADLPDRSYNTGMSFLKRHLAGLSFGIRKSTEER